MGAFLHLFLSSTRMVYLAKGKPRRVDMLSGNRNSPMICLAELVNEKAKKMKISVREASALVLKEHPDLARAYKRDVPNVG